MKWGRGLKSLGWKVSLLAIIANSDWRHGLEFDCNQKVTLVRGVHRIQLKLHLATIASNAGYNFIKFPQKATRNSRSTSTKSISNADNFDVLLHTLLELKSSNDFL